MQEEEIQNESKKNSRKEIWLFLIFIDVIVLCVLGFFIYNSFFDGLNAPLEDDLKKDLFMEEVLVEDIKTSQDGAPGAEAAKPKPEAKAEVKAAPSKPEAEKPEVKPEPSKPAAEKPEVKPAELKQSVFISGIGKTRKVTFKYYGDAKKVSVVAGFTMRKPVAMKKANGEWSATLIIYPGEYRYMYIVDGKEMPDPNAKEDGGRSVLMVR
jgi:hypothetical protein